MQFVSTRNNLYPPLSTLELLTEYALLAGIALIRNYPTKRAPLPTNVRVGKTANLWVVRVRDTLHIGNELRLEFNGVVGHWLHVNPDAQMVEVEVYYKAARKTIRPGFRFVVIWKDDGFHGLYFSHHYRRGTWTAVIPVC